MSANCSLLAYKSLSLVIMDAPSDANTPAYLRELRRHCVTDIVRLCDPTYRPDEFKKAGIALHDMQFPDGAPPPSLVVASWLDLVNRVKKVNRTKADDEHQSIAVHCVAGLGRAPVLVAIALIEEGLSPEDAIELIRSKRKGAINTRQLKWLHKYKSKKSAGCTLF